MAVNLKELFGTQRSSSRERIDDEVRFSSYDGCKTVCFKLDEIVEVDFDGFLISYADLNFFTKLPNLQRLTLCVRGLDPDNVDQYICRLQLDTLRISGYWHSISQLEKRFRVVETY
jgi:hypothetical protein